MTGLTVGDRVRIVGNDGQLRERTYTIIKVREHFARISERPGWGSVAVLTSHLRKVEP